MNFDQDKNAVTRSLARGNIKDAIGRGLDSGLLPMIIAINKNPNIVTKGSCSGWHATAGTPGHPFIELKFRDADSTRRYVSILRRVGFRVSPIFDDHNSNVVAWWYVELEGTLPPLKHWSKAQTQAMVRNPNADVGAPAFGYKQVGGKYRGPATPAQARHFWQRVTSILAAPAQRASQGATPLISRRSDITDVTGWMPRA